MAAMPMQDTHLTGFVTEGYEIFAQNADCLGQISELV